MPTPEGKPDSAPPSESAGVLETNSDVLQTTLIGGAAQMRVLRCPSDLMFLAFVRPSNVANEPRAAVTGSHKTVRRHGSI
jgi:hypothetical protein